MADVPDPLRRIAVALGFPVVAIPVEASVSRELAVCFLLGILAEQRSLQSDAVEGVASQLLKRELWGSTAIGRGFAFPHAKHPLVTGLVGICGWSATGVPWESLDGCDVCCICLMLSATDRPGDHLRTLVKASRLFMSEFH
jgi:mannitol/fructose-specific phosphotransferase system IIA component (Ntr-type)